MPGCPAVTDDKFDWWVRAMTARSPHGMAVFPLHDSVVHGEKEGVSVWTSSPLSTSI